MSAWLHHGTCTGCGHEARSERGHAQVSAWATHVLRDGDEVDAADREMTAAVQRESARQVSVQGRGGRARGCCLGDLLRTWKHHRTGTECGHEARSAREGTRRVDGGHSHSSGRRRGGRSRPGDDGGRAGGIGRTSEARETKRARQADIATTGH